MSYRKSCPIIQFKTLLKLDGRYGGNGGYPEKERLFKYHYINTMCIATNISWHKDESGELEVTKVRVQCLGFGTTPEGSLSD